MQFLSLLLAAIGISILSSCHFGDVKGSGHRVTETRKVDDFTKIELSGGYNVKLKQNNSLSVNITADDNLMKYVRTEVSGNKLRIYSKRGIKSSSPLEVVVGVKNLNEIKVSGAVNITSEGRINTGDFKFDFSGASKVDMDMSAANVIFEAKGATELHLKGQAAAHRVDLSGVGKLYTLDFVVGDYRIETSGASHCEINVLKSLEVNSKGASEVTYRGNPSSVVDHKSGASFIKKID